MERDIQQLREDLYRVIQHYAELSKLAKKGETDPLGQIGRILQRTAPYLLLVIRDWLPHLERGQITYYELLYNLIRAAQKFPNLQVLLDSRSEIQKIEESGRIFFYGVKWLDETSNQRPSPQEVAMVRKKLADLNDKYRQRYASEDLATTTLIPNFLPHVEGESHEHTLERMAELARRAVLQLHHLMVEHEPEKSFLFFSRSTRKEVEDDLMQLAWLLFRCGYSVDRIASGYFKDLLADFLNGKLLDLLISTSGEVGTVLGISNHLAVISLIDFASVFEILSDYCDVAEAKEAAERVKLIKSKNRRGWQVLKKLGELHKLYIGHPQGKLCDNFLLYRYYSAFGDYHGEHRQGDPRAILAIQIYKPRLDRDSMEKEAARAIEQSGLGFSSKTREEMAALVKLLMDSLQEPTRLKGKKVKILGDISSGAMGNVSVGIFQEKIVALKRVKSQIASSLGDPVALLEYEAAVHARVQTPEQHPYIVEYYGLLEQTGRSSSSMVTIPTTT